MKIKELMLELSKYDPEDIVETGNDGDNIQDTVIEPMNEIVVRHTDGTLSSRFHRQSEMEVIEDIYKPGGEFKVVAYMTKAAGVYLVSNNREKLWK